MCEVARDDKTLPGQVMLISPHTQPLFLSFTTHEFQSSDKTQALSDDRQSL